MKKLNLFLISFMILLLGTVVFGQSAKQIPGRFAWKMLQSNEICIHGWLKEQAIQDLQEGLPGLLNLINKDVSSDVFAHQSAELKQVGSSSWGSGEQEGYWHEGLVNLAFLANDKAAIQRATDWVESILKSQGPDGYIGIYSQNARLQPVNDPMYGENGAELHTQAHGFLALIAFYEHTGRADVLDAVEHAARLSMRTYSQGVFGTTGDLTPKRGGNSHIMTFADPMIQLYRLTGNEDYIRFVAEMYDDYNTHSPRDKDYIIKNLDDSNYLFEGHGAHTAESFHIVQAAALIEGAKMKNLPQIATEKLLRHLTPGGALVSGEMIDGNLGNGNMLYEHCTQNELMKSFAFITQYTGDLQMAERVAHLFYNGVQGAILHPLKALQYLSRDDRMDIPTNPVKKASNIRNEGSHFQMSSIIRPTCCTASAGRALPYFLASSWMKSPDGEKIALMNFAPCEISTKISNVMVNMIEETEYPFSDKVVITIKPDKQVSFELSIRLPLEGELNVLSASGAKITKRDRMLVLSKNWQKNDRIELMLNMPVICETTQDGKAKYYRRGSLVFGLPFKSEVKAVTENPRITDQKPSGLYEWDIRVPDKSDWGYRIDTKAKFEPIHLDGDKNHPWQKPTLGINGTMLDQNGKSVLVTLLPEGSSLSRRVTFLDETGSAEEAAKLPGGSKIDIGF